MEIDNKTDTQGERDRKTGTGKDIFRVVRPRSVCVCVLLTCGNFSRICQNIKEIVFPFVLTTLLGLSNIYFLHHSTQHLLASVATVGKVHHKCVKHRRLWTHSAIFWHQPGLYRTIFLEYSIFLSVETVSKKFCCSEEGWHALENSATILMESLRASAYRFRQSPDPHKHTPIALTFPPVTPV